MKTELDETITQNSQLDCDNMSLQYEISQIEDKIKSVGSKIEDANNRKRRKFIRQFHSSKNVCNTNTGSSALEARKKASSYFAKSSHLLSNVKFRRYNYMSL